LCEETVQTMNAPESSDPLRRTLAAWRVQPPADPNFRAEVWRRIGAGEAAGPLPWASYARRHLPGVTAALLVAVAAGAVGGQERARARAAADSARLAAAYVDGLDARSEKVQAGAKK
jgi:hypothetical protein